MKKLIALGAILITLSAITYRLANAQVSANYWLLSGGTLKPTISTWSVTIPQLGGGGTQCVQVTNAGLLQVSGGSCGGGGGTFPFTPQSWGNSTTSAIGVNGLISTASSTFNGLVQMNANATTSMLTVNNQLYLSAITSPPAPISGQLEIYGLNNNGITRPAYQDGCPELVLGRDSVYVAKNTSGSPLAQTNIVDITGSTGNVPNIANQIAATGAVGMMADGVVFGGIGGTSIGNNNFGCVMKLGIISSINTSAFPSDTMLYLSTTTPGGVVGYSPVWPDTSQMVGVVLTSGVGNGSIFYHMTSSPHNQDTGTVQSNWGIGGFFGGTRSLTFANGAGTTTLSITPSGTVAQTIPNVAGTFALGTGSTGNCAQWSSTNVLTNIASPCGTVTSVTGTYPIISSLGATPAISIAFGTTTSNTWAGTQTFTNPIVDGTLSGILAANTGTTYAFATSTIFGTLGAPGTVPMSSNGGIVWAATSTSGGSSFSYPFSITSQYGTTTAATTTMLWLNEGLYASTTNSVMQGLTIDNASAGDALTQYGATSHEWVTGAKISDFTFRISSSTTLGTSDALTIDKNLLVTIPSSLKIASLAGLLAGNSGNVYAISTSSAVALSITGNAATVTTNANLTGVVTSSGNATSWGTTAVANSVLANVSSGTLAPIFTATSTLFGQPTQGYILSFLGGANTWVATSTLNIGGSAVSLSGLSGNGLIYTNATGAAETTIATSTQFFQRLYSFGYSTTTPWTGTTTRAAAPFPYGSTVKFIECTVNPIGATLDIDWYYGPTPTHLTMIPASSTPGKFSFTSNNTPADAASSTVAIGTPAGTPTDVACTGTLTQNQ